MTPEERRDAAIAEVIEAGGVVMGWEPMADAADPTVIAAYRLAVGIPPTRGAKTHVGEAQDATEVPDDNLVPWQQPEPVEVAPEIVTEPEEVLP